MDNISKGNTFMIHLELTKEEKEDLEKMAHKSGMGISIYIRKKLFPNSNDVVKYENLLKKLLKLASETTYKRFDVPLLFDDDWYDEKIVPSRYKGILGRHFNELVKDKDNRCPELKNIIEIAKEKKGTSTRMQYKKEEKY